MPYAIQTKDKPGHGPLRAELRDQVIGGAAGSVRAYGPTLEPVVG